MQLLYFSPVAYDCYAQRPHFMARAWLERGANSVLWVNPYPCRLPSWRDLRREARSPGQQSHEDPRIRTLNFPALPIEPLPSGAEINRLTLGRAAWREIERYAGQGDTIVGVGRPCALAAAALDRLQPAGSFYDAMDNFPEFHAGLSRRAMRRNELAIVERVDVVVASSTFLAEKFARRGARVEKVLNACELAEEAVDGAAPVPPNDIENRRAFAPAVLGYVGCIGRWFDWPLVIRLARAMPDVRFELVGPCAAKPPERPPANVTMSPACSHAETIERMAGFSTGLIPFVADSLTAGVDPIKYYEYRAAGLPVLSTRFGEMAFRGCKEGVYFFDQDDPAAAACTAIGKRFDPDDASRFRRENNWRRRFQDGRFFSLLCGSCAKRAA